MDSPEPFTPTYRLAMAVCVPLVSLWGRLEVEGREVLPRSGPTLVVANHDSQTDPLAVGVAARKRRQIRALAKRSLWDKPGLGRVLDGMGQIPIERAAGDADALVNAVAALRRGSCIGVFPEGTISVGRELRARSGIGRLALDVPEARLVCAAVEGTTALARFPKRPRIRVRFFEPASGQTDPSESAAALSQRLLDELRALAPPVDAGRDPAVTLEKYERKLAQREEAAAKRRAEAVDREPD
jgi:1-acyl-sn-glycerol-3-phosphate acyltransferase